MIEEHAIAIMQNEPCLYLHGISVLPVTGQNKECSTGINSSVQLQQTGGKDDFKISNLTLKERALCITN